MLGYRGLDLKAGILSQCQRLPQTPQHWWHRVQQFNEDNNIVSFDQNEAPNKGGEVGQQNCFGAEYHLTVVEVDGPKLHFENGLWLNLVDPAGTTNPHPIVHQVSVPHGNSV
jgi:hypothetical protein